MSIFSTAWNWFTGKTKELEAILKNGKEFTNEVKTIANSPILDVVVNITKTPYDNMVLAYIRSGLTAYMNVMGWGEKTLNDFNADPDGKTSVLTLLSAKAAKLEADYYGTKLSIQQAIVAMPITYDGDVLKQ